eukprot:CFRG4603T1
MSFYELFTVTHILTSAVVVGFATYAASFYSPGAANVWFKLNLLALGVYQMTFSQDRKYKQPIDSGLIVNNDDLQYKTVVFIRHGESDWNEVFNRGFGPSFFVRLFKAIVREILMITTQDSLFFDSPLSALGRSQANRLTQFLKGSEKDQKTENAIADEGRKLVNGELDDASHKSVLVCSNLRRAIATASMGMQDRLQRTNEPIVMLSSLQEISRNIDTIALALPNQVPDMHGIDKHLWKGYSSEKCYDVSENFGTKNPDQSNGLMRMKEFAEWCFERSEDAIIVAGGHSLYGREFFKAFLPRSAKHVASKKKMENCAVVRFRLARGIHNGEVVFMVEESSIKPIYLGFGAK